jgi:S1-C subfamily serine protease
MRTQLLLATALLLSLSFGITAACSDDDSSGTAATAPAPASAQDTGRPEPASQQGGPNGSSSDATELVRRVRESVVRVRAGRETQRGPFGTSSAPEGTGTGFVIDQAGHVVTNNHVVTLGTDRAADHFEVDLWDGRTVPATLVGRDPATDLAVLRIEASDARPLRWAAPDGIFVGEEVFAIGFALDLGSAPTVPKGVVSATDRVINETIRTSDGPRRIDVAGAIQTDAAINPGNSGGPLVDLNGDVVGVNTAGLASAGGNPVQSIFFAVSSRIAEPIVSSLIESGDVERGYLGVRATTVTREIARANDLNVEHGAGLVAVEPGSAAERAGLRAGDVITRLGETEIHTTGDLTQALFRHRPGTTVEVEYVRDGERRTAQVTPSARPAA